MKQTQQPLEKHWSSVKTVKFLNQTCVNSECDPKAYLSDTSVLSPWNINKNRHLGIRVAFCLSACNESHKCDIVFVCMYFRNVHTS